MKNLTLIRLSILVLAPFLLLSCNSSDLSRADFEKIVIESDEFQAYMNSVESVRSLDDEVKRKFDEARMSGIVDDDDFSNFATGSVNARFTESEFLGKIGIANPEEFIRKCHSIFRDEINVSVYALVDKFPKIKSYSPDEIAHLIKISTVSDSPVSATNRIAQVDGVEEIAACLHYAAAKYLLNLVLEGETFAQNVYQQTRLLCYIIAA